MNTRRVIAGALVALALGIMGPARSQDDIRGMPIGSISSGITVSGHSEIKVKPDIALVTITVTTQDKRQEAAVQQNAVRTTAVLSALGDIKIAEKDIQTQSYTVQPQYDYSVSPPFRKGYQVQNSVQVTVRDLTQVGLVIDKATAGGASEIGGVSFDLSDRAEAESQALSQAVISAKRKAGVMASAAGVDLGRLLSMNEGTSVPPPVRPVFEMRAMLAAAPQPQTPIADQQITVSADATLVYAMGAGK